MFSGDTLCAWLAQVGLASFVILLLGGGAVLLWRQPVRRVRIIELALAGCLLVPWLGLLPGYPRLTVGPWGQATVGRQQSPPAAPSTVEQPAASAAIVPAAAGGAVAPPITDVVQPPAHTFNVTALVVAFYLAGMAGIALWWLAGMIALLRLLRASRPAPPRCRQLLGEIAGPRSAGVRLLVSRRASQPLAFAWRRPVIVLPDNLGDDEQALRWSLAHEWAHVEHHDFRAWMAAGLARLLFFYNPLLWWLRRQLRLCQDFLADAQASRQAPQAEDYAEFLTIRAAAWSPGSLVLGLGMGFRRSELYRRIIMLVQNEPLESRLPRLWTVSVTAAALILVAAVATLSWSGPLAADAKAAPSEASAAEKQEGAGESGEERLAMMGRVEDFFLHNFRDVTARKSLEWANVETQANGNRSIRYRYEATIWGKKVLLMNQVFTFDKQGKFVAYKNVAGFPKPKPEMKRDVSTKEGMMELVEDFFRHNWRDITAHKTIEWGEPTTEANGNRSIRYKFLATIWYSDTTTLNRIFTFDPKGEFVSAKDVKPPMAGGSEPGRGSTR